MASSSTEEIFGSNNKYYASLDEGAGGSGAGLTGNEIVFGDTEADLADMQRLGKKQEFQRNFSLVSTVGFISIYMGTWEFVLVSLYPGFTNGGFGGLFWVFIGTVLCYGTIVASLAEMESMSTTFVIEIGISSPEASPTTNTNLVQGSDFWRTISCMVSEFAPAKYQRILSYSAGWMSTLGWLASVSSSVYVMTSLIEAIIEVTQPSYTFISWQFTLIMLAFLLVTIAFNTWGALALPQLETMSLIGHLGGLVITIIPLLVMAPKNSAKEVFTEVVNSSGWSSTGFSCLIAQSSVLFCNLGSDSAVHISEEVEDASLNVPRAIWWSYLLNIVMGTAMLITMLFCIGPLDVVIDSATPYLILFQNTGSNAVTYVLLVILFLLITLGNITALAATSREVWAFSRDKGLPASTWISKMNYKRNVPDNAVYITSVVAGILCLINLGSSLAFQIIVSLSVIAMLSTYMISIGCVLRKRLLGEALPPARWSLGRWGVLVNAFAFFYSGFVIVFSCFPTSVPVTTSTANWAPAVWVGVTFLSWVVYIAWGQKRYTAPVIFVEGRRVGGAEFQGVGEENI